ncbi:MAG: putative toxin-antitoxin system toxin component, PIN family [Candidatus Diapherotrites archaeon]|nr:putative toxin-antitoxin system toxin component, PIN family [Candidatus Diapherotrites archaeon]
MDTNILVSAGLGKLGFSFKVFESVSGGLLHNFSSREILDELHDVFGRSEITSRINQKDRTFLLGVYEQKSIFVEPALKLRIVPGDADDDKFIHCALAAKAGYVVSGDQHLLKLKNYQGVRMVSPKDFIQGLF